MAANISVGHVSEVALARLRCWPDNPRRIVAARLDDLARSVAADREMLWARPVLALPTGEVFCGNQRLRAAQILGWESIPTLFLDIGWERAKQWALKDNNNWADWDEPALAALLAELQADGVDLALSGFETQGAMGNQG